MAEIVTIELIGHRGDGIARGPDGPIYVPFTLPGDRVAIERNGQRGRMIEVVAPSRERAAPPCRHFGVCGGCALQMMPLAASRRLKRDFVIAALAQQGLRADVAETIGVTLSSRRRAVLTALKSGKNLLLGYNERLTNRVVDIEECPVLAAPLADRLAAIRALIERLVPARKSVRVTALLTRGGLDLNLEGAPPPASRSMPELAQLAGERKVARLAIAGESILTLAEPTVEISGVQLVPPPGAFLQASAEAEAIMAGLVVEHLAGARRVADLFSGVGTFALALARHAPVHAVESSHATLDALQAALRRASGLKRVTTERRDLFAFPLAAAELDGFDGVVFDPPRAGAKAQAEALAASKVPRIAAISCNPASFARDARILVDGGYLLERVVPVDQFVYSAETEVVGCFRR
jgi:23S rRNA (uracil1939-C5)-methyltransferase